MPSSPKFSYIFVAISFVSTALLYVYFKNKVDKVDEKLDMMYQLIQSHAMDNTRNDNTNMEIPSQRVSNLIEVSDNDRQNYQVNSDSESDESNTEDTESDNDTESDSETGNKNNISLVLSDDIEGLNDIKTIEVKLNEENENDVTELTEINLKKINNTDDNDLDIEENHSSEIEESIENDQVKKEVTSYVDNILEEVDNTQNVSNTTVELNLNDNEEEEEEEEEEEGLEIDYKKFKVVDLKAMCRDKQLTNYAGLKKADLIDLLMSSV